MTFSLNPPFLASLVAALGGVIGSIITPLYGTQLTGAVQAVLVAISGLLVAIPVHHVASTAAANAKAKIAAATPAAVVHPAQGVTP